MFVHLLLILTLEQARIQAQLTDVLHELRAADVSGLSVSQQVRRAASIAVLEDYTARGEYPRRTDDRPGLRPRFIDDRGVHCAVGYLIAMSGEPELARAINARFEYAYVRDIDEPRLLAWAHEHGFTVDELARIQPAYGHMRRPPTPDGIRRRLDQSKEQLALACAAHGHAPRVDLHIVGDARGRVVITTPSTAPFARCVAGHAKTGRDDDASFDEKPKSFAFDVTLELPSPQQILDRTFAAIDLTDYCTPRPGPIPAQVTVRVTTRARGDDPWSEGVRIAAETEPRNAEIERCIVERSERYMTAFAKIPGLNAERTAPVISRLATERFKMDVLVAARSIALDCDPKLETVEVTLRAKRDFPNFSIDVKTRNHELATCIRDRLPPYLRKTYSVTRQVEGKAQSYFRIDTDIALPLTIRR